MRELEGLTLYQATGCPYCVRVQQFLDQHEHRVAVRNVCEDSKYLAELMRSTGSTMVPCLRIEALDGQVRWMHESVDIIDFLDQRISAT